MQLFYSAALSIYFASFIIPPPQQGYLPSFMSNADSGLQIIYSKYYSNELAQIVVNYLNPSQYSILGNIPNGLEVTQTLDAGYYTSRTLQTAPINTFIPGDDYIDVEFYLSTGLFCSLIYPSSEYVQSINLYQIGDVNDDGYADLGATMNIFTNAESTYSGIAFGGEELCQYGLSINQLSNLNMMFADVGDTNADGIDDFIMYNSTFAGIFYGGTAGLFSAPKYEFSYIKPLDIVNIIGADINNDGISDIIISANNTLIFAVYGNNASAPEVNLGNLNGENGMTILANNSQMLFNVADVGDINADSIDDLVLNVYNSFGTIAAVVYGGENFSLNNATFNVANMSFEQGFTVSAPYLPSTVSVNVAQNFISQGADYLIIRADNATNQGLLFVL